MEARLYHTSDGFKVQPSREEDFFLLQNVPLYENWEFVKIVFFCKTWVQRCSLLTKNSTIPIKHSTIREHLWKLGFTIQVMDLRCNPLKRKTFFYCKMCLFTKIENLWKSCFSCKTWVQRCSLLTKNSTIPIKHFTIREHLWKLGFTIQVMDLRCNPLGRKTFFYCKMCLFTKIENLWKSCFS